MIRERKARARGETDAQMYKRRGMTKKHSRKKRLWFITVFSR